MLIVRRSRPMFYPLVMISALVLVLLPLIVILIAAENAAAETVMRQWDSISQNFPEAMRTAIDARGSDAERMVMLGNVYLLAPFYLLIPLLVATVIAADTFAGEKERGTLEALLYTPMSDRELLLGKLLASWIPAVAVGIGGFLIYSLVLTLAAWPIMGEIFFPTTMWWLLVFWVGPAVAGMGLGAMVLVSARVNTQQEATQLGGGVVLPIAVLIAGQVTGILYFSTWLVLGIGFVVWAVNLLLLRMALKRFKRERLLLSGT